MTRPLYDPQKGKMRVAGLISGSGKSLLAIIEKQKEIDISGTCNFEVVGLFSDNPKSKAEEIGITYKLPFLVNDLKGFYRKKGASIKNLVVRREYDFQTADFLKQLKPDVVVYGGYVWATTEPLLNEFTAINGHPADLRVMKDGHRAYAGANGVGDALAAGERNLYSTLHLVTPKIDHGPILMVSEPVPVVDQDSISDQDQMRYHLRLLNEKLRELFAKVIDDVSQGRFGMEDNGCLTYNGTPIPNGFQL